MLKVGKLGSPIKNFKIDYTLANVTQELGVNEKNMQKLYDGYRKPHRIVDSVSNQQLTQAAKALYMPKK